MAFGQGRFNLSSGSPEGVLSAREGAWTPLGAHEVIPGMVGAERMLQKAAESLQEAAPV